MMVRVMIIIIAAESSPKLNEGLGLSQAKHEGTERAVQPKQFESGTSLNKRCVSELVFKNRVQPLRQNTCLGKV